MHAIITIFCIGILAFSALIGSFICIRVFEQRGKAVNISSLMILNYLIIYQISGIVHFIGRSDRGYFNILTLDIEGQLSSIALACVGLLGICWGCWSRRKFPVADVAHAKGFWLSGDMLRLVGIVAALILPLSVYAATAMTTYAGELGAVRVIVVDGGMARYAFMSHWLVWAISLIAILLVGRKRDPGTFVTLVVVAVSVVGIAAAMRWTGGRSIIILMAFPLIFTMLPRVRRARIPALIVASACFVVYLSLLSQLRSDSYRISQATSYASMIDWEWGRFSMLGFAKEYVRHSGLSYGRTFLDGLLITLNGIAQLLNIGLPQMNLMSASNIATASLSNSAVSFIVPGLGAESYMNFGYPGVFFIFFGLGRLSRWVDDKIRSSVNVLQRFGYSFLGSVLIFRAMSSDLYASYQFLIFSGAPVTIIFLVGLAFARRKRREVAAVLKIDSRRLHDNRRAELSHETLE